MNTSNQDGSAGLILSFILVLLLSFGAVGFGVWAFLGKQDYKNNVDQKVAAQVAIDQQQIQQSEAAKFTEQEKSPLRTYTGPEAYGSVVVNFPKTWSGYVDDSGNGQAAVDGYFAPLTVPSIQSQNSVFALRVQVVQQAYSTIVSQFTSLVTEGTVAVTPYVLPKVPSAVGVKVTGAIESQKQGTMVILPLRDKTLKIWTESSAFLSDYNTYILPNFSFSP